jgi:hypothetical protein
MKKGDYLEQDQIIQALKKISTVHKRRKKMQDIKDAFFYFWHYGVACLFKNVFHSI